METADRSTTSMRGWSWRLAPLVAAIVIFVGAPFVSVVVWLAPVSLIGAIVALIRSDGRRGVLLISLILNVLATIYFVFFIRGIS